MRNIENYTFNAFRLMHITINSKVNDKTKNINYKIIYKKFLLQKIFNIPSRIK